LLLACACLHFLIKTVALARVHPRTHQVASDLAEGTIDGGGKVKGRRTRKAADKKDQQEDSDDAAGLLCFCTLFLFHLLVSATTPQLISGVMAYKCGAILHKTFLYAKFVFTFALPSFVRISFCFARTAKQATEAEPLMACARKLGMAASAESALIGASAASRRAALTLSIDTTPENHGSSCYTLPPSEYACLDSFIC
jgi:hypothetical protein